MLPDAETRVLLVDRLGVAAVTYVLFGVKLGPALALSVVLVFAIWIGWRWLCRNIPSSSGSSGAAGLSGLSIRHALAVGRN